MGRAGMIAIVGVVCCLLLQAAPLRAKSDSAMQAGADTAKAADPAPAAPAGPKVNLSGFVTASYTYSTRHTGGAGSPVPDGTVRKDQVTFALGVSYLF